MGEPLISISEHFRASRQTSSAPATAFLWPAVRRRSPHQRISIRPWLLGGGAVAFLVLFLMFGASPAQAHQVSHLESYRVLTYNVAGMDIPQTFLGWDIPLGEEYSTLDLGLRAQRIADFIKAGDYDIVLLNEAWDNPFPEDSMWPHFLDELDSSYPYHNTEAFDGGGLNDVLDSGLMIFSKFPFVPIGDGGADECVKTDDNGKCLFAFHEYDHSACEDNFASKGIAFARVKNPRTDAETNIFFTHMQNDNPKVCAESEGTIGPGNAAASQANKDQVPEIVSFVKKWAPQGETTRDTILAGDLNIHHTEDDGVTATQRYSHDIGSTTTGLGAIGFRDSWSQTAPTDPVPSETNGSNQKVDYILHRPPPAPKPSPTSPATFGFCVQQLTNEPQFFLNEPQDDGGTDHEPASDHQPLAAVIAHSANHCSPKTALPMDPKDATVTGQITHPGSYQWFHFTKGGTYGFGTQSPVKMELTFYRENNLTTPITPYSGDGTLPAAGKGVEKVVVTPAQPFYLRVRAIDGTNPFFTGTYKLKVNWHDGTSRQDAIQLDAFATYRGSQMVASQNPVGRVWFMLKTDTLSSGAQQHLTFTVGGPSGMSDRLQVFDQKTYDSGQHAPLLASPWSQAPNSSNHIETPDPSVPGDVSPVPAKGASYYLTLEKSTASPGRKFGIKWTTNLFYVSFLRLNVNDMEDQEITESEDEPGAIVRVDGGSYIDDALGSMSEGDTHWFGSGVHQLKAASDVDLRVYENDGDSWGCPTDCDAMGHRNISPNNTTDTTNPAYDADFVNVDTAPSGNQVWPIEHTFFPWFTDSDYDGDYTVVYEAYRWIDK